MSLIKPCCNVSQQTLKDRIDALKAAIRARSAHEGEFIQAFEEIVDTLMPCLSKHPHLLSLLKIMVEPERVIQFRVCWMNDKQELQMNTGYRVQFNSALGPYKGGLRFHPTVSLSVLKFLGFEQIFKNALTGWGMGGGKGGSDFDPKGKSDSEVRSFCQAFMTELADYIGPNLDVPAGDIGVGAREIGFLYGQYRKLNKGVFSGTLTGKSLLWGGSNIRPEATGYGAVYFGDEMLKHKGDTIQGKRCLVSGSGNAAQYACEKLIDLGAVVLSVSDSNGCMIYSNGMSAEDLKAVMTLKNTKRGRLHELPLNENMEYFDGRKPWGLVEADAAFPAATQNEIDGADARRLISKGCKAVVEVANMPSTSEAILEYRQANVLFAPGKAANAGGVAVSAMEMSQNSCRIQWTREKIDEELKSVMKHIFTQAQACAEEYNTDLQGGANISAFLQVTSAMQDQGLF